MTARDFYQLSEVGELFNYDGETARQAILSKKVTPYISLSQARGDWIEFYPNGPKPESGATAHSRWSPCAPLSGNLPCYRLTGWFALSDESVWNIAHESSDVIEVHPTPARDDVDGYFNLDTLPIDGFMDLWVSSADYLSLRNASQPASYPDSWLDPNKGTAAFLLEGGNPDEVIPPDDLLDDVAEHESGKPMHTRERTTLYRIIATMLGSNYKPHRPYAEVAKEIALEGEKLGIELAEETLRKKLKEILRELPEAPP